MSPRTKLKSELITGIARKNLAKNSLPSELEVISFFRYQHENQKLPIGRSIQNVVTEALAIWNQAGLPHQLKRNVVRRVAKLVKKWQCLRKALAKRKSGQSAALKLTKKPGYLFDISVSNIEEELQSDTVRAKFWNEQMMAKHPIEFPENLTRSVPLVCKQCSERKPKKIEKKPKRQPRTFTRGSIQEETNEKLRRSRRLNPLMSVVVENIDRARVSNRGAVGVLAATAVALGIDPDKLSLSRSTLQRKRKAVRQEMSNSIQQKFPKGKAMVVHFDSKQLVFNRRKTEKLAIVVTGLDSVEQIISTKFLVSGTGKAVAEAVCESLQKWSLDGIISGKCYDTTRVNSGEKNGAAVILDRMLSRKLLDFPCRHHVFELVLMTAYKTCFEQSTTSPDDKLFKSFRDEWDRIDKSEYSGFPEGTFSEPEKSNLVAFCKQMLLRTFIRQDYAELLELALMCLADTEPAVFRRPGALHHARWMAKAIYGLKMYLFRKQFVVEYDRLYRFVLFVVQVYIEGWYEAPMATQAPLNDLKFIKVLQLYHDKELSQATFKKFKDHLWYLSELNISLAFFDENVDIDSKRKMVQNLNKQSRGTHITRVKKFSVGKELEDFVTEKSLDFFKILRLDTRFLQEEDPSNWNSRSDYLDAKTICENLTVVNDPAERALGAAGDYNEFGSKTDQEKHNLLMVVAENRKNKNNSLKASVVNYLTSQPDNVA